MRALRPEAGSLGRKYAILEVSAIQFWRYGEEEHYRYIYGVTGLLVVALMRYTSGVAARNVGRFGSSRSQEVGGDIYNVTAAPQDRDAETITGGLA